MSLPQGKLRTKFTLFPNKTQFNHLKKSKRLLQLTKFPKIHHKNHLYSQKLQIYQLKISKKASKRSIMTIYKKLKKPQKHFKRKKLSQTKL